MQTERRDTARRSAVFQRILKEVIENPAARFTFEEFQRAIGLPETAARGLLRRLVTAGLLAEVERGAWARTWAQVMTARTAAMPRRA